MTAPARLTTAGIAVLALLSVSGCAPEVAPPSVVASPSEAALFATDEEALAAAVEAYTAYLEMSDLIMAEGGAEPERIKAFADGSYLDLLLDSFAEVNERGYRSIGVTLVINTQLQGVQSAGGTQIVTIYTCEDVGQVDVVDPTGVSIVSESRPSQARFEVDLVSHPDVRSGLLVSNKQVWKNGPC